MDSGRASNLEGRSQRGGATTIAEVNGAGRKQFRLTAWEELLVEKTEINGMVLRCLR
jgi:hypothetical protein